MKKSAIIFGAAALLLAAAGAYATATTYGPNIYYYIPDAGGCEPIVIQYDCNIDPSGGCLEPTIPATNKQVFADVPNEEPCTVKLGRH